MKHDTSPPRRHMVGASLGTLAAAGLALVLRHECVVHPDSLAKYVAAFFKMSRFSLASPTSACVRQIGVLD